MPDAFVDVHRLKIISLARSYGLPAIYPFPYWAKAGGLISYGPEQIDNFRRAANYADQILKGTKPRELPVQGPVKFAMVINLKTAKTLGLEVPLRLHQVADEIIEQALRCPLLAQSGHSYLHCKLLLGVKRTCLFALRMSALGQWQTLLPHRNYSQVHGRPAGREKCSNLPVIVRT